MVARALPDDVETLQQLLQRRDETIAKLLAEIARLRRWRFGRSSERLEATIVQLQLALSDLGAPLTVDAEGAQTETPALQSLAPASSDRPAPRRALRALPAHLPRETIVHAPASCQCPECGGGMRTLG